MIRTSVSLVVSLFLLLTTAGAEERPVVKVGAILPLTGPIASVGEAMRRGIELGAAESQSLTFNFSFEDDSSAKRMAVVSAAKALTTDRRVDVVLNAYGSTAAALAPIMQRAKTPTIFLWDISQKITSQGEYFFGFGFSSERAARELANVMIDTLGKKNVAIVALHDDWSEQLATSFRDQVRSRGASVADYAVEDNSTTDFAPFIARATSRGADALYFPLFGQALRVFVKQAREAGFKGALLTAETFEAGDIKALGSDAEGVVHTQIWIADPKFRDLYEKKFGTSHHDGTEIEHAALAYDAMRALDALNKKLTSEGRSFSSESVTSTLPGFQFEGVSGKTEILADRTADRSERIVKVERGVSVSVRDAPRS